MINIYEFDKVIKEYPQLPFTHNALKKVLTENILIQGNINIIFTDKKYIKRLNLEYRNKDEITDVISFNLDEKDTLGEIYICPEYININFKEKRFVIELLRVAIHGILHLLGYDHKEKFTEIDYKNEVMYIKQEEILDKILKDLLIK